MAEIQGNTEIPTTQKAPESIQQTIDRVIQNGMVDKKEIEELLKKYDAEKEVVTASTKANLDGLDTFIKDNLKVMLENGMNIDKNLLNVLGSVYGYDISALDKELTEKIKNWESVKVVLDSTDKTGKKLIVAGFFDASYNDDKVKLSAQKVLELKKSEYINAIKFPFDEVKLAKLKTDIVNHPYKGNRESFFEEAIQLITGSTEKQNIVTWDNENPKYLSDYLDEIIKEAKAKKDTTESDTDTTKKSETKIANDSNLSSPPTAAETASTPESKELPTKKLTELLNAKTLDKSKFTKSIQKPENKELLNAIKTIIWMEDKEYSLVKQGVIELQKKLNVSADGAFWLKTLQALNTNKEVLAQYQNNLNKVQLT